MLLTFMLGDPPRMLIFFSTVALLMAINLAVEPNSSALALELMGNMAGMASAISRVETCEGIRRHGNWISRALYYFPLRAARKGQPHRSQMRTDAFGVDQGR